MENRNRRYDKYVIEYNQWKLVEKILYKLIKRFKAEGRKSKQRRYEIKNILERFLISHSNYCIRIGDRIGLVNMEMPWVVKMIEEMGQKLIIKSDDGLEEIVKTEVVDIWNMEVGMQVVPRKQVVVDLIFTDVLVKFADVSISVGHSAIKKLKLGLSMGLWDKLDIACMILKYKSHLYGSQQWGIPAQVFKDLYHNYGVRNEAFACPLNSRMMLMDGGRFCSLFLDTDQVFGSLGNFFDIDLLDGVGSDGDGVGSDGVGLGGGVGWLMNPPFIEELLEQSLMKVFSELERARDLGKRLIIFGVMPGWYDTKFYRDLKAFWGLKYIEILKPYQHFYISDRKIIARFDSVVYVLESRGEGSRGEGSRWEGSRGEGGRWGRAFNGMRLNS